jgi:hypothetical protein
VMNHGTAIELQVSLEIPSPEPQRSSLQCIDVFGARHVLLSASFGSAADYAGPFEAKA